MESSCSQFYNIQGEKQHKKKNYISEEKKYDILRKILNKHNIKVFYGDDENYFDKVNEWLNL